VVEVQRDGEVVFDVSVTPNHTSEAATYQVTKMDLYSAGIQDLLGQNKGQRKGETQSAGQITYDLPKFFIQTFTINFKQLYEKNGYLILQGNFLYQGQSYMLGKLMFVLKNSANETIFPSNPGINGNFEARIDLGKLKPGEYSIYAVGGVVDGMDALGKIKPGYIPTGYKIQIK
jgi:hypothetical protein